VSLIFQFPPSVSSKSPKVKGFHPSSGKSSSKKKNFARPGDLKAFVRKLKPLSIETGAKPGSLT